MKQSSPQQVVERLAERVYQPPAHCTRRKRGGACPACTAPNEFEIDREIAQIIARAPFRRPGVCPYRVVASHLVAGLMLGPEVSRARRAGRLLVDPVVEIKGARKRTRAILHATGLSSEDIEAISISTEGDRWQGLSAVVVADRALEKALALFRAESPAEGSRSRRGRTGALHNQAVARAMAHAWRQLTGRLPNKSNSKFHGLLGAAIVSIFGHPIEEPDLESATGTAVDRIRKDAASRS